MKDYENIGNCNQHTCEYFDENKELNCAYSSDDSKCILLEKSGNLGETRNAVLGDGWRETGKILPEKDGHYLVIFNSISVREYPDNSSKYDITYWGDGEWWSPVSQKITHWQPLPPLPTVS